jgi:hypothetical protein
MFATQQSLSATALGDVIGTPPWKSFPSWHMVAQRDEAIPPDADRQFAKRTDAVTEVATNHLPMVSHSDDVVKLIEMATETLLVAQSGIA